jgi:hypothetical protein
MKMYSIEIESFRKQLFMTYIIDVSEFASENIYVSDNQELSKMINYYDINRELGFRNKVLKKLSFQT